MPEAKNLKAEAADELLAAIKKLAAEGQTTRGIYELAEAFALVASARVPRGEQREARFV